MTLYDVLGAAPTATVDALHSAYRERARALHPDRQSDGSVDQRAAAEDAMRELNAAWDVLSDPSRRDAYDRSLTTPEVREPLVVPWSSPDDDVTFESPGVGRLARAIPLVLLLALLGGIFVFTAFAAHGPDDDPGTSTSSPSDATVGDCVRVRGGHVAEIVACGQPNDGEVVHVTERDQGCPADEQLIDGRDGSHVLCLAAP